MDESEKLVDKLQVLLLGMEERIMSGMEGRMARSFKEMEEQHSRRFDMIDIRLDSLTRELKLNNELLGPFIHSSHNVEEDIVRLSAQLQDVQARLKKLENPEPIV